VCPRSAYAIANGGREPRFTTFVVKGQPNVEFCEVLDYLFLSPHWHVDAVRPLPTNVIPVTVSQGAHNHTPDARRAFPMNLEPSDHLMLAATLSLA
jgi:hypothetical protein